MGGVGAVLGDDPGQVGALAALVGGPPGSFRSVTLGADSDEPIGEEVPIADAVEQRLPVGETRELSEDFQPTEASAIASEAPRADRGEPGGLAGAADQRRHRRRGLGRERLATACEVGHAAAQHIQAGFNRFAGREHDVWRGHRRSPPDGAAVLIESPPKAASEQGSMAENSGPEEAIRGVVEDAKGKAKEAVGTVTGRDDLVREGKAQQDKAEAERDAAKREAQAESARAGAKAAEERQKSNQ
jgi:uncharacterized protein YjbJ (UPF0337 family)